MKGWFILIILGMVSFSSHAGSTNPKPKIGLVLSGGAAKGLAHIGILKALDSAGLEVDYITGTSMGAIIGSLYAVGYSGKEMEKIVRSTDWFNLLNNNIPLRSLSMEEKEDYDKFAIEFPYIENQLKLPSGLLDGQEVWKLFSRLFFHVHDIRDFDDLPIPFKCIATDISSGNPVILDSGDIVSAVRASMAIPSVFSPVEIDGVPLVDGGVTRNFPVTDVIDMGAEYVIGSSVTTGFISKEFLKSPVDVLLQLMFFKGNEDYEKAAPLCDMLITQDMSDYSMADFDRSDDIIDLGIKKGEEMFTRFKRLADSLNRVKLAHKIEAPPGRTKDSVFISAYTISGLDHTSADYFIQSMNFETHRYYAESTISSMISRAFSSMYYRTIHYTLNRLSDETYNIEFVIRENASTHAKYGLHFNEFNGISVLTNLTTRDFFTPYSRTLATLGIGTNQKIRGEHLQYFGYRKNVAALAGLKLENYKIDTYDNFEKTGQYRQFYLNGGITMQISGRRFFTAGLGSRYEWLYIKPLISSDLDARGRNHFLTAFGFFKVNTLDSKQLPRKGVHISLELGAVFDQHPDVTIYSDGAPVGDLNALGIDYGGYGHLRFNAEWYYPIGEKLTVSSRFQTGINAAKNQQITNNYQVGGLVKTIENQILFAGIDETTISTPTVAALDFGLRYNLSRNIYLLSQFNVATYDFYTTDRSWNFDQGLTGYGLLFGYNTPIGPLSIGVTYSHQSNKVLNYVNFGIPF